MSRSHSKTNTSGSAPPTEPNGLTIRNLRAFFWLSRLESFHGVAKQLRVSQPAVSARIAQLEDALGVRLVSRGKGPTVLTAEGKEALRHAEAILANVDRLIERFDDQDQPVGNVSLGVVDSVARTWLPDLLKALRTKYPKIEIEVFNETTIALHDMLHNGTLAICISIQPIQGQDFRNYRVSTFDIEWVGSPKLVDPEKTYTLKELLELPLIGYLPNTPPNTWMKEYFAENNLTFVASSTTNSMSTMVWLAESGLGLAAVPPQAVSSHLDGERLVIVKTPKRFEPVAVYINLKERPYSSAIRAVEHLVREQLNRLKN